MIVTVHVGLPFCVKFIAGPYLSVGGLRFSSALAVIASGTPRLSGPGRLPRPAHLLSLLRGLRLAPLLLLV